MDTIETNAITLAAQLTLEYQLQLKDLLDTPLHNSIYMNVNNTVNGILNRLNHLSGQRPRTAEVVQFPPITDFMGEKIALPRDLSTEDLEPKEHEKQSFIQRVDNLEAEFRSLSMFSLMNSYTQPDDVLVLRGVAKRAGVEGYEDRAITERFIDDITRGLEDKEKNAALNQQIDKLTANVLAGDANQAVNSIQTEFPPLPGFDVDHGMKPVLPANVEEFTHMGEGSPAKQKARNEYRALLASKGIKPESIDDAMAVWEKANADDNDVTGTPPLTRDEVVARLAANGMEMDEIIVEMVEWDREHNPDGTAIVPPAPQPAITTPIVAAPIVKGKPGPKPQNK